VSTTADLVVIQNVRVVDPSTGFDGPADVVVEKGRVARVGVGAGKEPASAQSARTIDGGGRWVLPAFVDLHAHLREPGHEYKEDIRTGLLAAAAGGFAHVCVMPNTKPVNDTRAVTDLMLRRAAEAGASALHPIGAITVGQRGTELTEMGELREAGAVAVSDDGVCVMSASVMRRALEYARVFDMPVIQHCEDHTLTAQADMNEGATATRLGLRGWPRIAEDVILARDVLLAEFTKSKYHAAHLSTLGAVRIMREAKSRGLPVTCEVTPHHLLLTDAAVIGYDTACKVNPPLREPEDIEELRRALADGTVDAIATDHAPHSPLEKNCEFPEAKPGIMGLELCFGLLLSLVRDKVVSLERLVDALSTRPAQIAGLDPPSLKAGALANLVLVDPEQRWVPARANLASKGKNTPFLNTEITGRVLLTLSEGRIVYDGV
jgi:dihydroorotase